MCVRPGEGGGCYHTVRDMTDDWREFTNKSDLNSGGLEIINTDDKLLSSKGEVTVWLYDNDGAILMKFADLLTAPMRR